MLKPTDEQIAAVILEKLAHGGYWTNGHTPIDNTAKGIPSHDKGRAKKQLKN